MSLPCATGDLIPQTGKMGFSQVLTHAHAKDGESTAVIEEGNIFLDDRRRLTNSALVEYINQLSAAVTGYNVKIWGKPLKKGLFVGLQDAEFYRPVSLGDRLTLKANETESIAPVSFVQGIVESHGERIAAFVTKLYEVESSVELDQLTNQAYTALEEKEKSVNQESPAFLSSEMRRMLFAYSSDIHITINSISFNIACPEDFPAFNGHFPGNPLLPGVVLLEIGQLAMELFFNQPVFVKAIQKMKIGGVVLPGQPIACTVKIDGNNGTETDFSAIMKGAGGKEISRYNGTCVKEEMNGDSKIG